MFPLCMLVSSDLNIYIWIYVSNKAITSFHFVNKGIIYVDRIIYVIILPFVYSCTETPNFIETEDRALRVWGLFHVWLQYNDCDDRRSRMGQKEWRSILFRRSCDSVCGIW